MISTRTTSPKPRVQMARYTSLSRSTGWPMTRATAPQKTTAAGMDTAMGRPAFTAMMAEA